MNDHLTPIRSHIMHTAHKYKNQGFIKNTWSTEGKLLCRDKDDRVHEIVNEDMLKQFGTLAITQPSDPASTEPKTVDSADPPMQSVD